MFWSKRVNFMHFFKVYKVLNIITNRQLTTMCKNPIKVARLHEKRITSPKIILSPKKVLFKAPKQ